MTDFLLRIAASAHLGVYDLVWKILDGNSLTPAPAHGRVSA